MWLFPSDIRKSLNVCSILMLKWPNNYIVFQNAILPHVFIQGCKILSFLFKLHLLSFSYWFFSVVQVCGDSAQLRIVELPKT